MQLADHFDTLLTDTVNLGQVKLHLLARRVDAVYSALKADTTIGDLVLGKTPQGSWPQRTIIEPVKGKEFDADFMLNMSENSDWSDSPKTYIDEIYSALHRHGVYGSMPLTRKCRSVRLSYANSMHVDIVPHLNLADGREVIVHRDENRWENTNPQGFTNWMKDKDSIANNNLRRVIRLMKYLRDHKNSFTGTRSIILTTLLGEQVTITRTLLTTGYYSNVPTTLLHVVTDLDVWLQARPYKPSIAVPGGSGETFDHRWDQSTYSYFRDRIRTHASQITEAYDEPDRDRSIRLWQDLFGDGFKAPASSTSASKFPTADPAGATVVGRSGRAG